MEANKVAAYVDNQVKMAADFRIRPLIDAVTAEIKQIQSNEDTKAATIAAMDKSTTECNQRIAKLQSEVALQKAIMGDLAEKLAAATNVAVS